MVGKEGSTRSWECSAWELPGPQWAPGARGRGPHRTLIDSPRAPGAGRESGLRVGTQAKRCSRRPEGPLSPTPPGSRQPRLPRPRPAAAAAPIPNPNPAQLFLPCHLPRRGSTRERGRTEPLGEGEKLRSCTTRPPTGRAPRSGSPAPPETLTLGPGGGEIRGVCGRTCQGLPSKGARGARWGGGPRAPPPGLVLGATWCPGRIWPVTPEGLAAA